MHTITVLGLGYTADSLTLGAVRVLQSGQPVVLHTKHCGCAEWLAEQGLTFESLDFLYDETDDFDEHEARALAFLAKRAQAADFIYGVFDVRDRTVLKLTQCKDVSVKVLAGPSVDAPLHAYADGALEMLEASDWEQYRLSPMKNTLVRELNDRTLACEVKLKLMDCYPEACTVFVCDGSTVRTTELYALDRLESYDHRTAVLVPAVTELTRLERFDFDALNRVMQCLLAPNGCPWDRAQTHATLRPYILEEAYEVIDAIDEDDPNHLYDELGDMLFQVVFHAALGQRHGEFTMGDVTSAICEKMIARHSHIFGHDRADNAESVSDLWAKNKMAERGQQTYTQSLREITRALPATLRACKVEKRLRRILKVEEPAPEALTEDALGEALLSLCVRAQCAGLDPEIALNRAVSRRIDRFEGREKEVAALGQTFESLSKESLQAYWDLVKHAELTESK